MCVHDYICEYGQLHRSVLQVCVFIFQLKLIQLILLVNFGMNENKLPSIKIIWNKIHIF